jgi:hypothetical protein
MVPSHRQLLRARLLSFRYMDGPCFRLVSPRDAWVWEETKVTAGLNPADPAAMVSDGGIA